MDTQIPVAKLGKPHAMRGEVWVHAYNPQSTLIHPGQSFYLKPPTGSSLSAQSVCILRARSAAHGYVVAFHEFTDRDQVEAWRGAELWVEVDALPNLDAHEYYHLQLKGLDLKNAEGEVLGKVDKVMAYPSVDCLLVSSDALQWEVPMTSRYVVDINLEDGCIVIAHADELREIYGQPLSRRA